MQTLRCELPFSTITGRHCQGTALRTVFARVLIFTWRRIAASTRRHCDANCRFHCHWSALPRHCLADCLRQLLIVHPASHRSVYMQTLRCELPFFHYHWSALPRHCLADCLRHVLFVHPASHRSVYMQTLRCELPFSTITGRHCQGTALQTVFARC